MSIVFLQKDIIHSMEFSEWITHKYIEWRGDAVGRERSVTGYAEYLGVTQQLLSGWMNGEFKPAQKNAEKIANKVGGEVYEVLEIPQAERPVPKNLRELINKIPPENQEELRDLIEAYILRQGWERIA
jgi:hypothetical protein